MNTVGIATNRAPTLQIVAERSVRDWVAALAHGSCNNVEFLRHFKARAQTDPDIIWEALALLDQNFRSQRIDRDLYIPLKSSLQQFSLGHHNTAEPAVRVNSAAGPEQRKIANIDRSPTAAATTVTPSPLRLGTVLRGRYRVIGILGTSAAGTVVEAIDEKRSDAADIQQRVAIRVRETRDLNNTGQLAAYLSHVCKLQTFSHPNLIRIIDLDQDQGRSLLTMELLNGLTLAQITTKNGETLHYSLDRHHVIQCVANALIYTHTQGAAHGKLSPDEVFVTQEGEVKITGLECSFVNNADGMAKDYLAFAWLAYDVLSSEPRTGKLHRPSGLSSDQWRALKSVLSGGAADGPYLLQKFSSISGEVAIKKPSNANKRRGNLAWGSLIVLLASGISYLAYSSFAAPTVDSTSLAPKSTAEEAASQQTSAPTVASSSESAVASSSPTFAPPVLSQAIATPQSGRTSNINLEKATLEVSDGQTVARVRVKRRGNLRSSVEFVWWTENGSAQGGVDFNSVSPRTAQFPAGASSVELFVPLVPSVIHKQPSTFYVKVDEAGIGAELGEQTLVQISLVPQGYVAPPETEDSELVNEPVESANR
jgi:Protein kinase domain/Calx-beta domain